MNNIFLCNNSEFNVQYHFNNKYHKQVLTSSLCYPFPIWEEMHIFCINYFVDICKLITTKPKTKKAFILSVIAKPHPLLPKLFSNTKLFSKFWPLGNLWRLSSERIPLHYSIHVNLNVQFMECFLCAVGWLLLVCFCFHFVIYVLFLYFLHWFLIHLHLPGRKKASYV